MKIGICGDIHWSTYSSILRNRGKNFSIRLEGLIRSMNWMEQLFKEQGCEEEIFLGDTFDKPDLTSEEISALCEVEWNNKVRLRHFIVGNHESGLSSLVYSSTQALHKLGVIEDTPYIYPLDSTTEILFLPYITEDNRKPLADYLEHRNYNKKLIVASHNDLKDFQMGPVMSTNGFKIEDILENCDLYINGHLHNGSWVTAKKILNLGVLTGQNFGEDAFKYEHHVAILDTDTLEIEFFENPYAFNFYKIEVDYKEDIKQFYKLKPNAVISIKCLDTLEKETKQVLDSIKDIAAYRIILYREESINNAEENIELNNIDHLKQFQEFVLERKDDIGDSNIVKKELTEVCK